MARTYSKEQGGTTVLSDLRTRLAQATSDIRRASSDEFPPEYRRRIRREKVAEIDKLVSEGRSAFRGWVAEQVTDARRRYNDSLTAVGSAAEEARRNTDELRVGRLVDAANRAVTPRDIGRQYGEHAMSDYLSGRYAEAILYGRAAMELGVGGQAKQAHDGAQDQIDLDYPERVKAKADIASMGSALATFERDAEAGVAEVNYAARDAALAMGDDHNVYTKEASRASYAAKMTAYAMAEKDLDGKVVPGTYVEPAGVNPPPHPVKSVLGGSYNGSGS